VEIYHSLLILTPQLAGNILHTRAMSFELILKRAMIMMTIPTKLARPENRDRPR
jgi:hypothetical protein